jgi:pyruvate dehydrogenase E2 component (dihydrolipoamide acetyltransferase)
MSQFLMPSLGSDMEAGILVEKLAAPGETVHRGDVIAAVETQKGVIEIEVFEDGILAEWLVPIGEKVPVGTPLAVVRAAGETSAETPGLQNSGQPEAQALQAPAREEFPQDALQSQSAAPDGSASAVLQQAYSRASPVDPGQKPSERLRATPAARRLAARLGLDLNSLARDPAQTLYRADVEARQEQPQAAGLSGMRAAIAAAMARSKREIPHYYLSHMIDLTAAQAFIIRQNTGRPPQDRLLVSAAYVKALALAVRKFPEFNGHFRDGGLQPSQTSHVGLAINLRGGGLVAPALFDPAAQSLDALMQSMRNLVARVRAGRFQARELTGATITLSSLGDRGVDQLYGVIYPPQVAIIGIGAPSLRPWVHQQAVVPRQIAGLTLAADHRASDGHRGALLLNAIDNLLQHPEEL